MSTDYTDFLEVSEPRPNKRNTFSRLSLAVGTLLAVGTFENPAPLTKL